MVSAKAITFKMLNIVIAITGLITIGILLMGVFIFSPGLFLLSNYGLGGVAVWIVLSIAVIPILLYISWLKNRDITTTISLIILIMVVLGPIILLLF